MSNQINRGGWLAIGLGVLGGVIALVNVFMRFQRSGVVDWGQVALAFGVPILLWAIVRGSTRRP